MPPFRVALAQINPTVGDIPGNTRLIIDHIRRAVDLQADLIAFPELCVTGYPPEDLLYKESFLAAAADALQQIVKASTGITVIVGIPERATPRTATAGTRNADSTDQSTPIAKDKKIYNAAAVIHDGEARRYLPQDIPPQLQRL